MTKLVDMIYTCHPPGHIRPALCTVSIYVHRGHSCVMLTERSDNPGMSVTNAAEQLATELVQHYHLDPTKTRWIEHYPALYGAPETFDALSFTWHGKIARTPTWRRVTPGWVRYWSGERIEDPHQRKTTGTSNPVASP